MAYSPPIKIYYGPPNNQTGDQYRLVPAPLINISTVPNYVNDSIVGYDYIITLNGNITALDLRTGSIDSDIEALLDRINEFSQILHYNGGVLSVVSGSTTIIRARGGILQSFNVDRSSNRWVNYAPFTAEFKFNEIDYDGCEINDQIACSGLIYSNNEYNSSLIDISKYKISSFSDGWNFDLSDQINNRYSSFHNESFNIEYTISANGKLFFNGSNLLPAWEQAKNFCQDRLYTQVTNLIKSVLIKDSSQGCTASKSIDSIYEIGSSDSGLLNLNESSYGVYNETITCKASESAGSFSATYNAVIKKQNISSFTTDNATHTFTVERRTIDDNATKSTVIAVQGEIQGLIPGGLINSPVVISLPSTGKIFLVNDTLSSTTKYDAALATYNKIINNKDLIDTFKEELNIKYSSLGLSCGDSTYPINTVFNVDHNYADGIINYSAEYNSVTSCLDKTPIRSISVIQTDPTPRIAEFVVPGRASGPIIQRIGSDQPRTITVNINGVNNDPYCCLDLDSIVGNMCIGTHGLLPAGIPNSGLPNMITTEDSYTSNLIDGSFVIKREYICYDT